MQPTILGLTVGSAIAIGLARYRCRRVSSRRLSRSLCPTRPLAQSGSTASISARRRSAARAPRPVSPRCPTALKLSLGGPRYAHGVPLNVNTDLAIDLKGAAHRFTSMVGIDDLRKSGTGSATFDVWVDGKLADVFRHREERRDA